MLDVVIPQSALIASGPFSDALSAERVALAIAQGLCEDGAPQADLSLAAGTTWLCFTDQVLHAALAGHCALEQTFHLPVEAMTHPERSPLGVLERLAGRTLA